jgi:heme/copper-type cytochrome/quinol oxidase subunit 2
LSYLPLLETTNDSGSKLGLIIGCVVAAVFVALIAFAILCVWVRRSRRQDAEVSEQEVTVEAFFMTGEGASDFVSTTFSVRD